MSVLFKIQLKAVLLFSRHYCTSQYPGHKDCCRSICKFILHTSNHLSTI